MAPLRTHRRALTAGLAAVAIVAALVIGLAEGGTGSTTPDDVPTLAEARADVEGSPPAIARLYAGDVDGAAASRSASGDVPVLDLGSDEQRVRDRFQALLATLRGRPVVVNVWYPQCAPCLQEFPILRTVAARYGKQVAFVGLVSEGSRASVDAFLRKQPTVYPHVLDRGKRVERADLQAGLSYPNTVLIDRKGAIVDVTHAYTSVADVERDLARLGVRSASPPTTTTTTGGSAR